MRPLWFEHRQHGGNRHFGKPQSIQRVLPRFEPRRLVDPDRGETLTLTVDWGDGSKPQQITPDRAPFTLLHRYKKAGSYTVHLVWSDSSGLSNSRDLTLTVTKANAVKAHHRPRR